MEAAQSVQPCGGSHSPNVNENSLPVGPTCVTLATRSTMPPPGARMVNIVTSVNSKLSLLPRLTFPPAAFAPNEAVDGRGRPISERDGGGHTLARQVLAAISGDAVVKDEAERAVDVLPSA